jgi:hypothetical protein
LTSEKRFYRFESVYHLPHHNPASKPMPDINYPTVVVTGLVALCAAYLGARLARDSEYEKWYRQERTSAIAEFLRQLYDTRIAMSAAYFDTPGNELAKSTAVTETFLPLQKYFGILALYLSANGKERLSSMTQDLFGQSTGTGGPPARSTRIRELMDTIQQAAENEHRMAPPPNPDGWKVLTYRLLRIFKAK